MKMRSLTMPTITFCVMIGTAQIVWAFMDSNDFSNIEKWKITAEGSKPPLRTIHQCRAVGRFDSNDVTILLGQPSPIYGRLSLHITMHQRILPDGYQGAVELLLDTVPTASGTILDVGNWRGRERTATYSRASFNKIEALEDKLRQAHKLTIQGDANVFKPLELSDLELDKSMRELHRCMQ
jgi:hypothetical protein